MKLTEDELDRLSRHYTGNCFGCERCSFFMPILNNVPGAVEAYVKWVRASEGREVSVTRGTV